jgi:hypothetical protein
MRSKRKRASRPSRSVCLPVADILEAERKGLPFFEPYDTRKLLADAAKANNGNASDAAIAAVYDQHWCDQMVQLLGALGYDPKDKHFWAKSFLKLARLHHNLGACPFNRKLQSRGKWNSHLHSFRRPRWKN